MLRLARQLFTRRASSPRNFPSSGFKIIDGAEKLEEENWDWYEPGIFYPVRIGEVFQSRYQVVGKLGYGSRSTAWLCRDLIGHKYIALKVCERETTTILRELAAYNHLSTITTTKAGAHLVRKLLDTFKIIGSNGVHHCFTVRDVLLQPLNIHLSVEDESILKHLEEREMNNPSPRKIYSDRVIHDAPGLGVPKSFGRPVLCDFGEARFGATNAMYTDDIQPYVYRAPEVILDIPWTYSADIWNVGVMIWDMLENKHLFEARDENNSNSTLYHIAEMVAILGPPSLDYLRRSETSSKYFDSTGNWIGAAKIPNISLENSEENLEGENKVLFLNFIRKMLKWVPEERYSAEQLLEDPWLKS
ncbi:putative CDK4/6 [Rhodocollybia butyracea]|uniref:non-specific serine/threonine protein kinase n=1 Tax=Rhodocollybia butyracea TaxID=206335 RepID=A0A9P5Q4N5_9AGAR|nr:putative CDK4/6 [Rhodocollybia butyracea]